MLKVDPTVVLTGMTYKYVLLRCVSKK